LFSYTEFFWSSFSFFLILPFSCSPFRIRTFFPSYSFSLDFRYIYSSQSTILHVSSFLSTPFLYTSVISTHPSLLLHVSSFLSSPSCLVFFVYSFLSTPFCPLLSCLLRLLYSFLSTIFCPFFPTKIFLSSLQRLLFVNKPCLKPCIPKLWMSIIWCILLCNGLCMFRLIRPVANSSDRLTVHLRLKLSQVIGVVSSFIQS